MRNPFNKTCVFTQLILIKSTANFATSLKKIPLISAYKKKLQNYA
ncbi:hypothetical protein N824_06485 [Pedobacter sp. V48]|nr:hypothetical protein N824_06485 [Pedobacter sp. V48]